MNKIISFKPLSSNNKMVPSNKDFLILLENLIVCKFDVHNSHILSKPVILPCGNTGKIIKLKVLFTSI